MHTNIYRSRMMHAAVHSICFHS
uniref:Uncharacterized protein n=1 Tax=Arundo donax TaxID=35708 RepID=A0A0A9EAL9_ARUDO